MRPLGSLGFPFALALSCALPFSSALAGAVKPDLAVKPAVPKAQEWKAPVPERTTTPGGTSVIVLGERELPIVHVVATVAAGSALDPREHPGLAAAVAMMLEEGGAGARSAPELAHAFAALGVEPEIHVDPDTAELSFSVLSRNLDAALALLADMLARPRFDAAEWPRAQALRVDEIRRRLDEPPHLADEVFQRVLYGEHPYAHPSLGTPESLGAITIADLKRFYAEHYGPRTVSLVLVGDTTPAASAHILAEALKHWQSAAAAPKALPPPKAQPARVVIVDRPGAPQSQLRVGHLGRERKTADFAALSLLETVLGGSFTSRLNQNLRERHGYAYGARAAFDLRAVEGPFDAQADVRTDVTGPALEETVRELTGMRAPIPDAEVQKGRSLVLQTVVDGFSDGKHAAFFVADLCAHGLPLDDWAKLPERLAALDGASLTRAAQKLFFPDALTIVVVGDRKAIEPQLKKLAFVKTIELWK
jgi:predicted Zn-dependent peptidase